MCASVRVCDHHLPFMYILVVDNPPLHMLENTRTPSAFVLLSLEKHYTSETAANISKGCSAIMMWRTRRNLLLFGRRVLIRAVCKSWNKSLLVGLKYQKREVFHGYSTQMDISLVHHHNNLWYSTNFSTSLSTFVFCPSLRPSILMLLDLFDSLVAMWPWGA